MGSTLSLERWGGAHTCLLPRMFHPMFCIECKEDELPGNEANLYHHHVYLYQLLLNGWMCVHLSILFSVSRTIDIIIKQYWYIAGTMFYCIVGNFDTPRWSHLKAKWSTSTYQRREGGPPLLDTCLQFLDCKIHLRGYFIFFVDCQGLNHQI